MSGSGQRGRGGVRARQHVRVQQLQHGVHAHAAAARLHAQPHALHQPLQAARPVAAAPAHTTIYDPTQDSTG